MKTNLCENCKHFVPHYVNATSRFRKVCCGHCLKPHTKGRQRKTDKVCTEWQETETQPDKHEKAVPYILTEIAERLKNLEDVLRAEK